MKEKTFSVCLRYAWGLIEVVCTTDSVLRVSPTATSSLTTRLPTSCPMLLQHVVHLLKNYFCGEQVDFSDIPMHLTCGSDFQQKVWQAIRCIPYGEVRTYQWIADYISQRRAVRAVGNAVGANPISLLIPCHRVIRSNGQLGGYSAGLARKRSLLALEKAK